MMVVACQVIEVVSIFCTGHALQLIRESTIVRVHHTHSLEQTRKAKQWRRFQKWVAPISSIVIPSQADGHPSGGGSASGSGDISRDPSASEVSECSDGWSSYDGTNISDGAPMGLSEKATQDEVSENMKVTWLERCNQIPKHPMDNELKRRKLMLLLYLLRSPIFDR